MARISKIELVRKYLNGERSKIIVEINDAVQSENFIQAEQLKEFRQVLSVAIQMCEKEKPTEGKNGSDN